MFLLPLAFFAAIALTVWFVFMTEPSGLAKVLLAALCIVSLLFRYSRFWLVGLFLQVAISIFVLLYQKARA